MIANIHKRVTTNDQPTSTRMPSPLTQTIPSYFARSSDLTTSFAWSWYLVSGTRSRFNYIIEAEILRYNSDYPSTNLVQCSRYWHHQAKASHRSQKSSTPISSLHKDSQIRIASLAYLNPKTQNWKFKSENSIYITQFSSTPGSLPRESRYSWSLWLQMRRESLDSSSREKVLLIRLVFPPEQHIPAAVSTTALILILDPSTEKPRTCFWTSRRRPNHSNSPREERVAFVMRPLALIWSESINISWSI